MNLPRLRLHLLTCVVLMFAAGALIWANLTPRPNDEIFMWSVNLVGGEGTTVVLVRGWPFLLPSGDSFRKDMSYLFKTSVVDNSVSTWFSKEGAYNLGVALGILLFTALVSEWLLRRRGRLREGK